MTEGCVSLFDTGARANIKKPITSSSNLVFLRRHNLQQYTMTLRRVSVARSHHSVSKYTGGANAQSRNPNLGHVL